MEIGRVWVTLAITLLFLEIIPFVFANECTDPHCLSIDQLQQVRPADAVRNMLTGDVVAVSSRVIEEIQREGKPSARRFKIRRYPIDPKNAVNITLGFGDVTELTLNRVKYIITVIDLNKDQIQLKILPTREFSNLTPRETRVYDLNHDNQPDIQFTLGEINGNQVIVEVTPGSMAPPSGPPVETLNQITTMAAPIATPAPSSDQFTAEPAQPTAPQYTYPSEPMPSSYTPPSNPVDSGQMISEPAQSTAASTDAPAGTSSGMSALAWSLIISLSAMAVILFSAIIISQREKKHVSEVTNYVIDSIAHRVPLPSAVDALSKAGWSQRITDKALADVASKYRDNTVKHGGDPNVVRNQLAAAGMPEEILGQVFK